MSMDRCHCEIEAQIRMTSLQTKDELADRIKEALENQILNMEIEFTQPIEMFQRINFGNPI
jgi:cobalt-zinc-cadmium resistance protein CzcA